MFVSLWHYLNGYVIVEVGGFALERFMNLMMNRELDVWDVCVVNNKIQFKMQAKDFKSLKPIVRKAHCRVKVIRKYGLPFFMYRHRRRKFMPIGLVVFLIMIWSLSSFVWLVDVEGANRLNSIDIVNSLEEQGYGVGKWKTSLNLRQAESYLVKAYPDIIWTALHFEGTRLVVEIAETVPPPDMMFDTGVVTDIVAKRDALVTSIAVYKGMPKVKKGDIVKKGDVLVAGQMPLGAESEELYATDSKAKVTGKTVYSAQGEVSLTQVKKHYTNEVSRKYCLKLFNHSFKLWDQKIKMQNYDTQVRLHQLHITRLFPLPFAYEVDYRIGYNKETKVLTMEEAKDMLLSQLWKEVEESLSKNANVLKREVLFKETADGVTGTLHVVAEEEIGYKVEANPLAQPEVSSEGENAQ
ncbi:sporulation protein YqfD [Cellulosilyticum ruminicola]|uniref:sporulation protein YqfD n=1 Tax=Cellulosilyticum ruminicola TaxID=425254 RepID=UPI0006D0828A|nr:sporulation protein YqfD [Cellulosilyticum ruminicola]